MSTTGKQSETKPAATKAPAKKTTATSTAKKAPAKPRTRRAPAKKAAAKTTHIADAVKVLPRRRVWPD